jgi:hypothetical protein
VPVVRLSKFGISSKVVFISLFISYNGLCVQYFENNNDFFCSDNMQDSREMKKKQGKYSKYSEYSKCSEYSEVDFFSTLFIVLSTSRGCGNGLFMSALSLYLCLIDLRVENRSVAAGVFNIC